MSFKGLIGMACLALLGPVKGFVAPTLPTGTAARAVARGRGTVRMVAMEPRQVRGESRQGRKPLLTASDLPGDWAGSLLESQDSLTYMPFMEWAANMLGTQLDMTRVEVAEKLSYAESVHPSRPGRIASVCFQSPEIRKARMTYFDAGPAVQVFNMVIYPDPSLDVPLLGVDLISFGDKNLAGIDFQPLYDGDEEYNSKYVQQMVPIKAKYPELGQKISQRYYESSKFFSEAMLFARYEDPEIIPTKLFDAFTDYFSAYLRTLKGASGKHSPSDKQAVLERHAAYDQYNRERDPAHGMFNQYFGEDWAEGFIADFLFDLSVKPATPHKRGKQQQPKA